MQSPSASTLPNPPLLVLEEALKNGRMPHAVLLKGPCLASLEDVALHLGQRILGASKFPTSHPDLFTLRPSNKMRQIQTEALRDLILKIQQTSFGSNKVAIVYEADRFHSSAANAFLKTLEEPPPGTIIFLLTTRPQELLPTIISRCFQFTILSEKKPLTSPTWLNWLDSYSGWISALAQNPKPNETDIAKLIIGAYSLVYKFDIQLDTLAQAAWKQEEQSLEDTLSLAEKASLEASCTKNIRQELFTQIAKATRKFAVSGLSNLQDPAWAKALTSAIHILEKSVQLLNVNLSSSAVLEIFLLRSLKVWIAISQK